MSVMANSEWREAVIRSRSRVEDVVRTISLTYSKRKAVPLMSHKYRGSCVAFSISKSVEPNEEVKVG
jgi:hypothetical protein